MTTNLEELITSHLSLADQIAATKKRLVPKSVHYEDLQSAAYMGLVDAANKYDSDINPCFKSYAYPRIAGAIKDYLRECGWGPRNRRKSAISIDQPCGEDGVCMAETLVDARCDKTNNVFDKATSCLSSLARLAIKLYYMDGFSMKEVGDRLGVSESRISQVVSNSKHEIRVVWANREIELWQEVA